VIGTDSIGSCKSNYHMQGSQNVPASDDFAGYFWLKFVFIQVSIFSMFLLQKYVNFLNKKKYNVY
jgi:hypothetical protein